VPRCRDPKPIARCWRHGGRAAATLILGALLVGAGVAAVGSAAAPSAGGSPFVALPVVPCAVDFGVSPPPEAPSLPTHLTVQLPSAVARRLDFYSDGFQTLLAPRGLACHGLMAADGGRHLSAFPAGNADPAGGSPSSDTGVTLIVPSPGTGQVASIACALFPSAQATSGSCSTTKPAAETVTRPTAEVALFHDPPHVRGAGTPSGGTAPADGAVIYVPTQGPGGAAVTCALASRGPTLCPSIISYFLTRDYPLVPPGQLNGP
jgi:hypothetical protein